jgi:hypothetical protein
MYEIATARSVPAIQKQIQQELLFRLQVYISLRLQRNLHNNISKVLQILTNLMSNEPRELILLKSEAK